MPIYNSILLIYNRYQCNYTEKTDIWNVERASTKVKENEKWRKMGNNIKVSEEQERLHIRDGAIGWRIKSAFRDTADTSSCSEIGAAELSPQEVFREHTLIESVVDQADII